MVAFGANDCVEVLFKKLLRDLMKNRINQQNQ